MADKRKFYVHTKGNEVMNEMLAELLPSENMSEQLCKDGRKRNVWLCTSVEFVDDFIVRVARFRHPSKLYELYMRERPGEPLELWPYDDTAPRSKSDRKNHRSRIRDIVAEQRSLLGIS